MAFNLGAGFLPPTSQYSLDPREELRRRFNLGVSLDEQPQPAAPESVPPAPPQGMAFPISPTGHNLGAGFAPEPYSLDAGFVETPPPAGEQFDLGLEAMKPPPQSPNTPTKLNVIDENARERFYRAMGDRDLVSEHNLGNIDEFAKLLSRSAAAVGNVRGEMAQQTAPAFIDALSQHNKELIAGRRGIEKQFQEEIQGKRVFEAKLAAEKAKQKSEAQRAAIQNQLLSIKANDAEIKRLRDAAMRDPNSPESMVYRLVMSGMGLTMDSSIPGSALEPIAKSLAYIYGTSTAAEREARRQEAQAQQFQAGQAAQNERLDKTLQAQGSRDAARLGIERERLALEKDKAAGKIVESEALTQLKRDELAARQQADRAKLEADKAKSDADRQAKLKIAADANRRAEAIAQKRLAMAKSTAAKPGQPNKAVDDLRKEYLKNPTVQESQKIGTAWARIQGAFNDPSAAGDLNLIFGYMKLLDPGSTVREGEFANAQNAGSAWDKVGALYNNVMKGQRLTAKQRADFQNSAKSLYAGQMGRLRETNSFYKDMANRRGLNPRDLGLVGERKKIRLPSGFKGKRISYKGKPFVWNETEKVYEEEE